MSSFKQKDSFLKVMGIHLAGSNTHKTALVRGGVVLKQIRAPMIPGPSFDIFSNEINRKIPGLPVVPFELGMLSEKKSQTSPLFWEAFSADIGASSQTDSDSRLVEAIKDLGGADVFCIDAPLSLPPCLTCSIECKNAEKCVNPIVSIMNEEWKRLRKSDKKSRMPQPYLDRYFEFHARNNFHIHSLNGGFELEAVLGSGRAPLTSRAIYTARQIERLFPKAIVIETNSSLSELGWAAQVGYPLAAALELRHGNESKIKRAGLLKRLEQKLYATRHAGMHADLFVDLATHLETFHAAMGALMAWGFLNGEYYFLDEFLTLEKGLPLRGWACVPKDVLGHGWSQ